MAELHQPPAGEDNVKDKSEPLPSNPKKTISPASAENNSGTSIGPGTSDQGFEPGEEDRDDEFRNDVSYGEVILDKENVHHNQRPTHGLVEEGPGPDS
jgi:hypothetical protein